MEDISNVGSGTATFLSQLKPHAILNPNVKALLIDDKEYSTP
jgi:hypothetical protein